MHSSFVSNVILVSLYQLHDSMSWSNFLTMCYDNMRGPRWHVCELRMNHPCVSSWNHRSWCNSQVLAACKPCIMRTGAQKCIFIEWPIFCTVVFGYIGTYNSADTCIAQFLSIDTYLKIPFLRHWAPSDLSRDVPVKNILPLSRQKLRDLLDILVTTSGQTL